MTIRIGINPLTWTNDDMPELGAETPLETCLSEAKLAGYDGVELGNKFPRTPAALGPILQHHGLALASGWHSVYLLDGTVDDAVRDAEAHLTLLSALGSKVMVLCDTTGAVHGDRAMPVSRRPTIPEAKWAGFAERLTRFADAMLARGVRVVYHHHMGTIIQSEAEIDRMMAMTGPSVGLLLDTGHLTYAGGDPLATARRHIGRIAHVHCKDVRADVLKAVRAADKSFLSSVLDGVFTVPGDGSVDYPPIFDVLRGGGYSGWLVVEAEQDPAKAHPLTYARMGHDYLVKASRNAGLQRAA